MTDIDDRLRAARQRVTDCEAVAGRFAEYIADTPLPAASDTPGYSEAAADAYSDVFSARAELSRVMNESLGWRG